MCGCGFGRAQLSGERKKMKRVLVLVAILALAAGMSFAQEAPASKIEVFGGYSLLNVRASAMGQRNMSINANADGWNSALTLNLTKNFGITTDFAGYYKGFSDESPMNVSLRSHSVMIGPKVSFPTGRVKPFAHVLFGVNRISASGSDLPAGSQKKIETSFATAVGGGVDVQVSKHVALRMGQFDFFRTRHVGDMTFGQNNLRFSTGVVFNFGK
jgi:opacity protein-like surface antigen